MRFHPDGRPIIPIGPNDEEIESDENEEDDEFIDEEEDPFDNDNEEN